MTHDDPMKALERLKKTVESSEKKFKRFETPGGFEATLDFFANGNRNLTLQETGLTATFEVMKGGRCRLMELRGPDDEHLDDPALIDRFQTEADQTADAGLLEPYPTQQQDLDL